MNDTITDIITNNPNRFEFVVETRSGLRVDTPSGGDISGGGLADIMLDKVEATKLYEALAKFLYG